MREKVPTVPILLVILAAIPVVALLSFPGYSVFSYSASATDIFLGAVVLLTVLAIAAWVYTGLLGPGIFHCGLLWAVVVAERTTPPPEQVGDGIYLGSYVLDYSSAVYVWLALFVIVGLVEFGLRRGYDIRQESLQNLTAFPLEAGWRRAATVVGGISIGIAVFVRAILKGAFGPLQAVFVGFLAALLIAVTITALYADGAVSPLLLCAYALFGIFNVDIFGTPHGGFYFFVPGVVALVCLVLWKAELFVRSRLRGWDGGRFRTAGE